MFDHLLSPQNYVDSQQDISEFTHMLLEWLEDAFKLDQTSLVSANDGQTTIADDDANIEVDKDEETDDETRKKDRMELGEIEDEDEQNNDEGNGEKKDQSKEVEEGMTIASTSRSQRPSLTTAKKRLVLDTSATAERDGERDGQAPLIKNPMVELFYGQYETDGTIEGKVFANSETFGQFPLQVEGFSDLHESLEAATAPGDIEMSGGSGDSRPLNGPLPPLPTTPGGPRVAGGQEQWFLKLPPVIMYELSRFHFNQQLGQPEKIHNRLSFPKQIFMVRVTVHLSVSTDQNKDHYRIFSLPPPSLSGSLYGPQQGVDPEVARGGKET